jgi:hypothetical protein
VAATSGLPVALNGSVIDDGKGGPVTLSWSQVAGSGVAVFSNPSDASTMVTFSRSGPYTLRLSASDTQSEVCADLVVNVLPNTNVYADWIALNFPGETNSTVIGRSADPDADRMANLLEFALGLDPKIADANPFGPGHPGLPVGTIQNFGGTNYLALLVKRPIGRLGVQCIGEVSGDLVNWTQAIPVGSPFDNGDGTETLTFRDFVSVPGANARFARLRVSPADP